MQNESLAKSRVGAVATGSFVVGRAVRSTLVISAIAVLAAAARSGDFRWSEITRLAWAHRVEFAMILMALVVWESWVAHAKRLGAARRARSET